MLFLFLFRKLDGFEKKENRGKKFYVLKSLLNAKRKLLLKIIKR